MYIPVVAPSLAVSHVNLKDGQVDFVPGENLTLNDYGIVDVSGETGIASIDYITPVIGFTSFAMDFDETEHVYSGTSAMLGLYKNGDDAFQQFVPSIKYVDQMALNILSRCGSTNYGSRVSKGGYLVVAGCLAADTDYGYIDGVYATKTGKFNRSTSNKLCYYSNIGSNQDGKYDTVSLKNPISVSGICGTLSEDECHGIETIFKTFKSDIGK